MPNNSSRNGKWSGDDRCYAIVKNLGRAKKAEAKGRELLSKGRYHYDFGDGWCAAVSVSEVDAKQARHKRSKSRGFCGYDWMVDSIIDHGVIRL